MFTSNNHHLAPPLILADIQSLTLTQYDNATFKCNFQDSQNPQVTPKCKWYCNNREIQDAGKFIIESKPTLSILDIAEVDLDDAGEYKFVVSNEFGESESVATLIVNGAGWYYFFLKIYRQSGKLSNRHSSTEKTNLSVS